MKVVQVENEAIKGLHIQLLGGFSITIAGRTIPTTAWKSRRASSLVKLLALAPDHRLHRDQLIDALWPDSDLTAAANNFYQTLYTARRILDPLAPGCLRLEESFLRLTAGEGQALAVDVEQFEAAVLQAKDRQEPAAQRAEAYQAALDIYRGDLLPEDLYEEWTVQRRAALRQSYLNLLLGLAGLYETRGEYEPGIAALQRLLDADHSHEEAHVLLMRLYARAGQRQQALRQYQALVEALREELDTEPGQAAEQLYQAIESGRLDAAPASAGAPTPTPNNLPAQLTSFIGRESQITEVGRMVRANRLVTLTGAGGTGKTRLALQAAEALLGDFPGGVFLVELAPVSDPDLLPQVCAQILELIEQPGIPLTDLLAHYLEKKQLLLILDNCEHVLDACAALVARLAKACPRLHILTTSREIISVTGESAFRVPSLALPQSGTLPPLAELAAIEAVRLFVDRARQTAPGFVLTETNAGAVVQICRRLDGIPLALELAAGRARVMAVEQIAARLDDVFRLLTSGSRAALPRQQTLKATIDWSYQLLTEKEQALFQRLSVFAGGWSLEAAEQVGADAPGAAPDGIEAREVLDLLSQLVDKSLVQTIGQDGQVRYGMLEIIRQYAREKLASDQLLASGAGQAALDRHLAYYARLTGEAERHLRGKGQVEWLDRLDGELDNIRAALEWSRVGQVVLGLKIAADLMWYWHLRGLFREGAEWQKELLELERQERGEEAPAGERAVQRARALRSYANVSQYILVGTNQEREAWVEESIRLLRSLPLLRQAGTAAHRELGISLLFLLLFRQYLVLQPSPERDEMLSIFAVEKEKFYLAEYLFIQSGGLSIPGRLDEALESAEASLAICREIEDLDGIGSRNDQLGFYSLVVGDYHKAKAHFEESMEYSQKVKNPWYRVQTKSNLILLAMVQGEYAEAYQLGETALAAFREMQYEMGTVNLLLSLIESAWSEGNDAKVFDYSRQLAGMNSGPHRERTTAIFLARNAISQGDLEQGAALLKKAISFPLRPMIYCFTWQHLLNGWIALWMKQGRTEPSARLLGALDWFYRRTAAGLSPRERSEHDADLAAARAGLGPEAFDRAWQAGQDMTMEQALAFIEQKAGMD